MDSNPGIPADLTNPPDLWTRSGLQMIRSIAGIGDSCLWNLIILVGYSKSCDQFQLVIKFKFLHNVNYVQKPVELYNRPMIFYHSINDYSWSTAMTKSVLPIEPSKRTLSELPDSWATGRPSNRSQVVAIWVPRKKAKHRSWFYRYLWINSERKFQL